MSDQLATFVNVILPLPLPRLYTYRVLREHEAVIQVGCRVVVQFGSKRMYVAIVQQIHHQPPAGYEAKYVVDVLDEVPLVTENMMQFWHWMSTYYLCSLGEVMNAALPSSLKPESKTIVVFNPEGDLADSELSDREYLIVEALSREGSLTVDEVMEIVQLKNIFPLLKSLYLKGIILMQETVEETYKPRFTTCIKLTEAFDEENALRILFDELEKHEKQLHALIAYIQLKHELTHIEKKVLLSRSGVSDSSLKTLIKKGVFELYTQQIDRIAAKHEPAEEPFTLNTYQQQAYDELATGFKTHDVALLHGITSSGKTHIYVKLIDEQLRQGKQTLLLLPEIALTSQIIHRVQKHFGSQAIAFHSRFSSNERYELWNKVKSGEAKIVIGARSAIFLPFQSLGLVIVDEEHEQSYKQHDPAPRYHARDAAIMLAHIHQCKTLLGSATPSFESYYNTQQNRYALVELKQRHGNIELPKIELANLAEEKRVKTMHGHFTHVLYEAIEQALQHNEQVILFQNRRGYAPILECEMCRFIPRCKNCDISMTYHKYNDSLKCHYCGYSVPKMTSCAACGSHQLELKGIGTEKIEDEIGLFFPHARTIRLDLDSTRTKHGHTEIIRAFEAREADIMVGTQMLSKGLDFGAVSVVGVINADQLLYFPDFRAHERAYQLLTQVSGRAGRKQKQGRVIIQTSVPHHHVLHEIATHHFNELYANEIEQRRQFGYPPFTRLIHVDVKHKEYSVAAKAAFELKQLLYPKMGEGVVGPETPYVGRIKNLYIKELLIKLNRDRKNLAETKQFIKYCTDQVLQNTAFKGCIITLNVDPL
jgi:primosomal protein N' (replication factor Y)